MTGVIRNRSALCSEGGVLSSLLVDMVEGYTATLLGQETQPSPSSAGSAIVQTLLCSSHPDLPLAVVLSVPHLVDIIMALHWDGLTDAVSSKLAALIGALFEHFHGYMLSNLLANFAPASEFKRDEEKSCHPSPPIFPLPHLLVF